MKEIIIIFSSSNSLRLKFKIVVFLSPEVDTTSREGRVTIAATEAISMATSVETSMATRGEITREIVVDTIRTIGEITGADTTRKIVSDWHREWSEHFVGLEQWTDRVTLERDTILEAVATTLIVVTEISSITNQDIAVVIMGIFGLMMLDRRGYY